MLDYQKLTDIEKECEKLSYLCDQIMAQYLNQIIKAETIAAMNHKFIESLRYTIDRLSEGYKFEIRYNANIEAICLSCDDFDITLVCDKDYEKIGDYFKVVLIMIHNGTWIEKYEKLRSVETTSQQVALKVTQDMLEEMHDVFPF